MLFFPDRAGWGGTALYGAEGSAWQASGPAGPELRKGSSHPAEDGLYSRLKKMPYLYDNKDAEFLNQFKLLLTGQYQGAQVSPSGANRFRKALMAGKTNGGAPDRV